MHCPIAFRGCQLEDTTDRICTTLGCGAIEVTFRVEDHARIGVSTVVAAREVVNYRFRPAAIIELCII